MNRIDIGTLILILAFVFVIAFCIYLVADAVKEFNEMSDEELAEMRASRTHEYDVYSVTRYIRTRTNNFGGITGQDLCYAFSYSDGDKICERDGFRNLEYGLTHVCIGEKNMYVIRDGFDQEEYLYLTEETMRSLVD